LQKRRGAEEEPKRRWKTHREKEKLRQRQSYVRVSETVREREREKRERKERKTREKPLSRSPPRPRVLLLLQRTIPRLTPCMTSIAAWRLASFRLRRNESCRTRFPSAVSSTSSHISSTPPRRRSRCPSMASSTPSINAAIPAIPTHTHTLSLYFPLPTAEKGKKRDFFKGAFQAQSQTANS